MKHSDKIIKTDPINPQEEIINRAAGIIKKGGLVVFPTRCLYGLGVDALNVRAVEKIFYVKKRSKNKPILIIIKRPSDLKRIVKSVTPAAISIMNSIWPGKVTLIFKGKDNLPENLTGKQRTIGVRVVEHPVARALLKEVKRPITATSANISLREGCWRISDLDEKIIEAVDMILDAGPLEGGLGSTVVDVSTPFPKLIRAGSVAEDKITKILKVL